MFPRSILVRLSFVVLPLVALAACSKAGSNNEDDLILPATATFTVGGTLTGLDAAEAPIELRLDHDFSELFLDDEGLSRPTSRTETLTLDATRNDQFYAFEADLPAGTQYQVRVVVQPQTQGCEVDNRDGVIPDDDVVNVDIRCNDVVLAQPALNDTGIDWCADDLRRHQNGTALEKEEGAEVIIPLVGPQLVPGCQQVALTHPGQDGHVGRDAIARTDAINATDALGKQGAGEAGFDFTKVSNSGNPLPPGAALGVGPDDWACTLDNVTGLLWEVKVDNATHLRHLGWTYSWYDSSGTFDGGTPGREDDGVCLDEGRCDIEKFVVDVNAQSLCGADDWRMPMREELRSIMHYGRPAPAVDPDYFPDLPLLMAGTFAASFWTGSPYAGDFDIAGQVGVPNGAWTILADGGSGIGYKPLGLPVRLVRGSGGGN